MSAATIWALVDADDYCVGEHVGCCRPGSADAAVPFDLAVLVDRRGDLMIENLVVDRAAGTGRWVTDEACRDRAALLDRLNGMDRVDFLAFVLAEARAILSPSSTGT